MLVLFLILLLAIIAFFKTDVKDKFIKPKYENVIKSDIDYDSDGLDDYTDILNGAKDFISKNQNIKVNITMEDILQMNTEYVQI